MKRLFSFMGLVIALFIPAQGIVATSVGVSPTSTSTSEHITELAVVSDLSSKNVLTVQETITVDFAGIDHHGIYRTVPIIQRSGNDVYYYQFALTSVTSPSGASAKIASLSTDGDNEVIKIGDANQTVNDVQTYIIKYTLSPVALDTGIDNRVILNITGQSWEYPIDSTTLDLTLPATSSSAPVCYTGVTGSTDQLCTVTAVGKTIEVRSDTSFEPGEGMTLDARLPSGSFTTYLVAGKRPPLSSLTWAGILLTLLLWILAIITLIAYISKRYSVHRLRKSQTVYAQYEAPDGLTPGQIGLLVDSTSNMTEFTATLIDLAIRGYLKITQTQSQILFVTSKDYSFTKLKPADGLASYEADVYNLIFRSGDESKMSEITDRTNSVINSMAIKHMRENLGDSLKAAGYYGIRTNLVDRYMWAPAAVAMLYAPFGSFFATPATLMMSITALAFVIYSLIKLRGYPLPSASGMAEWAKVEGFKLYLSMAEKDRINFTDAPDRTPERYNKFLPYAVALKVEKEWAKQFDGIDVTPANGWYAGSNMSMISSAAFASTFASSFSSSVNSSFAGSGGAGGAGGGGGGGGGGGW